MQGYTESLQESFNVALQVSLNFQSSLESLHWNFQSSPASLHWKFQSNLQPPLKVWLKVCNKLSTNFQGSKQKYRENLFFLKKIVFIFLKTMFVCFKKMSFSFQFCFVFLNRFHVCYWLKKHNIGIYCWDHFKRSNPKYGLLFFVSVFYH